ncbi:hypothetical protein DFH07DRAFT_955750 [Mycena maculata]|uniref:MYND-type domain-containing protein n=1 Tax=Mycena maculata TaxID=230809 RepID=A0AAD7NLI9_9AGAR|nr:hypothetical protein DFH07DRAFT_955750 [Mycena maculata]
MFMEDPSTRRRPATGIPSTGQSQIPDGRVPSRPAGPSTRHLRRTIWSPTPRAIGASLDEYRTCPCCHGPSSLFVSTGMGGNGTKDAATAKLSAEQAADKFAALLGLNQTPEIEFELPPHEKSRCEDATEELCRLWGTLMPGEENPTDPIICAFCAKYLPSLVASYKADPCAFGPHFRMLIAVLQSNYFAKFMRTPQGSELTTPPTSIVGLLIFATYAHEYKLHIQPLSEDVRVRLDDWLHATVAHCLGFIQAADQSSPAAIPKTKAKQGRRRARAKVRAQKADVSFYERILQNIISVLNILQGRLRDEALQLMLTRRETFDRYAVRHANEHEHLREEGDIGDDEIDAAASKEGKSTDKLRRLECGRCQTVAYCCKVHQKEDWRGTSSSITIVSHCTHLVVPELSGLGGAVTADDIKFRIPKSNPLDLYQYSAKSLHPKHLSELGIAVTADESIFYLPKSKPPGSLILIVPPCPHLAVPELSGIGVAVTADDIEFHIPHSYLVVRIPIVPLCPHLAVPKLSGIGVAVTADGSYLFLRIAIGSISPCLALPVRNELGVAVTADDDIFYLLKS